MSDCTTYIAMDTHKKEHKVALHYPCHEQIVRFVVKNTARDIKRMVTRITKQAPADVVFCYEAGVCGFTLKRRIEVLGCKCAVIAAQENLKRLRHQLLKFLTRHGYLYSDGEHWPGELMSYLGLTPSESSSGEKQNKGPITRTGNKRVRRLLIEAAWHYRHPYIARSKALRQRRKDQPQWVIDIADRAGQRLRKRYWHLINSGKIPCKATVAIARELAGFVWSVFREYQIRNQEKAA